MGLIHLSPFTPACITPTYLGWLNDRHLMRYSSQRFRDHTEETARAYLATFAGTPNHFWAVFASDGHMVGTMTGYRDGVSIDLGIMIGESGKGYGRDAWGQAMVQSGARHITAGTSRDNLAMLRIFTHYRMRLAKVTDEDIGVELWLA